MEEVPIYFPPRGGPTEKEVAAAHEVIIAYNTAIEVANKSALIRCIHQVATGKGCGEIFPIAQAEYIQTHWYTRPRGCTEGDYWNVGEGQCICPKCGHRLRLYDSPKIEALKKYFKSVKDEHKD